MQELVDAAELPCQGDQRFEESDVDRYPRLLTDRPVREYTPREVGLQGEMIAAHFCELRGYELLERNWRCPWGEADIIARDGDAVVLVEVKTRLDWDNRKGVQPELAVTEQKLQRYRLIALAYLCERPGLYAVRVDVAAVTLVSESCAKMHYLANVYLWED